MTVLYHPGEKVTTGAQVQEFLRWLSTTRDIELDGWDALHRWSVTDLTGFWSAIWDYFDVRAHTPYEQVLAHRDMPGARWFPGATLNYAEHCLGRPTDADRVAVTAYSQTRPPCELTYAQLADQVRAARAGLRRLGVGRGDRVVAYLPNIPETLVAFLATASLGAVWASCAPEFGAPAVLDRFGQVEPTVLLTVSGYSYGAKDIDRRAEVARLCAGLPTVGHVVHVPYGHWASPDPIPDAVDWNDLISGADAEPSAFEPVPFDHPLCVLFSSGTTGKPKAIVHGHGGILLEHLKNHAFHWDLRPGDRMLWFTTTAWMMWNALVSTLLTRASMVLLDGNPLYPELGEQWRIAEQTRTTHFGASPGFLMSCRQAGMRPAERYDLSAVRQVAVSGSPLPREGFTWVHEQFGDDVLLAVGSGGTDVCTGLVQASPLLPVYAGEMSGPSLGVAAQAFDHGGHPVVGELGELVITEPMPSMPVGFWGDTDGRAYRAAYFAEFPRVWRHGDWIRFSPAGSCVITGRSDATLNRGGVRLGTAEFYRVVEELPEIADSLVVHLDEAAGMGELILFVRLCDDRPLDDALRERICREIRTALSPRHVPDRIEPVSAVPYTRTGKKVEVPVKRILRGEAVEAVIMSGALADPGALAPYVALARAADQARCNSGPHG